MIRSANRDSFVSKKYEKRRSQSYLDKSILDDLTPQTRGMKGISGFIKIEMILDVSRKE
jgi:hypothetical protein